MPSNTTFDPRHTIEFDKTKLNKAAQGKKVSINKGTTTNIDLTLTDDMVLAGGSVLLVKDVTWGDKVTFQVLSGSTVIIEFITNWYLNPDKMEQTIPTSNYPAKVVTGLTLRIVYTSVAGVLDPAPELVINYNLEKVLT